MKSTFEDNHPLKQELYRLIQTDVSYFEFIQNSSLVGMWYWDLENLENIWMSPRFWEILGYDPKDKKHLTSEWQHIIFEDDLKIATENFHKHLEDSRNPYDQIVRYRHKDGSTVWIRCRGISIKDDKGKPVRMLGAHNDLTSIIKLQKELTEKDDIRLFNEKLLKKEENEFRVYDHIYYNSKSKTVRHEDTVIKLTDQEISLFELFIKNKNKMLSLNEIEYMLNPNKYLTSNALSLILSRLRKKLPLLNIKSVYGQGYIFLAD
ncbi:MAG: PAS domain-containing protein [Campylobacterales bacterium]|nr:PAS domain-containing protein [Campylobacterales bacterium]